MEFDASLVGMTVCVTAGRYGDYEILGHFVVLRSVAEHEASNPGDPRASLDALVEAGALQRVFITEVNVPL